jgi:hypothetical protein
MEAICSSETSVDLQRTERRYIPGNSILHNHRFENLKSYMETVLLTCSFSVAKGRLRNYPNLRIEVVTT